VFPKEKMRLADIQPMTLRPYFGIPMVYQHVFCVVFLVGEAILVDE
jgi:hypothetical protein